MTTGRINQGCAHRFVVRSSFSCVVVAPACFSIFILVKIKRNSRPTRRRNRIANDARRMQHFYTKIFSSARSALRERRALSPRRRLLIALRSHARIRRLSPSRKRRRENDFIGARVRECEKIIRAIVESFASKSLRRLGTFSPSPNFQMLEAAIENVFSAFARRRRLVRAFERASERAVGEIDSSASKRNRQNFRAV